MNYLINIASSDFNSTERLGKVHSVFRKTVNLSFGKELYTLGSSEVPIGPKSAIASETLDFSALGIKRGMEVLFEKESIKIPEALFYAEYKPADIWEAVLNYPIGNPKETVDTEILKNVLVSYGDLGGMGEIVFLLDKEPSGPTSNPHIGFMLQRVRKLMEAFKSDDWEAISELIPRTVGFGPGLTPSSDDMLVGIMCAVISRHGNNDMIERFTKITDGITGLTTDVSLMALKSASEGKYISVLSNIALAVLTGKKENEIKDAAIKLIGVGQTSGTDMLAGLIMGLGIKSEGVKG